MKKSYVSPAIEITEFKAEDIVRTSMFAGHTAAASDGVNVTDTNATLGTNQVHLGGNTTLVLTK